MRGVDELGFKTKLRLRLSTFYLVQFKYYYTLGLVPFIIQYKASHDAA
jgi:hypothetical protein